MKVAIPVHNGRVSPTFDWAMSLLVVETSDGDRAASLEVSLGGLSPPERVTRAKALGADVLLCGGISNALMTLAESSGVRVVPWVAGGVDDVLKAFVQDRLAQGKFTMPGCRGRGGAGACGGRRQRRHRKGRGRARGSGGGS